MWSDNQEFIYSFIKETFEDSGSFERLNSHYELYYKKPFENFYHFLDHQKKCISKLTEEVINSYTTLIKMIKMKKINICDEDDFIEYNVSFVYFNTQNKFVIMKPK